jgi:flavin reductase (DIM6/NTAB) family NADH-FMN oxidoreductase RutF
MSQFNEIKPEQIGKNPLELIGKDWMLVTAEKDGKVNTMTASWGGLGVMWGKNVAFVVVRPQRYTKEFIDNSDTFSLSFLDNSFKKVLSYLGSVSGRDEDKIKKSKLTIAHSGDTPYFEESNMVVVCKKLYAQNYEQDCIMDKEIIQKWYPNSDYHTMYIAEITKVLVK